jgi:hypothetical protein
MAVKLGSCDQGCAPPDAAAFLAPIHETTMRAKRGLRGEADSEWLEFTESPGSAVRDLQRFLKDAGFFPHGKLDGICGYRTTASLRLFQEYVRTVEQLSSIGAADGIVGAQTREHIERWKTSRLKANWTDVSSANPTEGYRAWMRLLSKAKEHYAQRPTALLKLVGQFAGATDTTKVPNWTFDPERIHLIGIRCNEGVPGPRVNDDVFVLLINGVVFKFFGTTDPGKTENESGAPFLVPGQHLYRFGWHKMGDMARVYQALKPLRSGVLVIRDINRDAALTDSDLSGALTANASINVHWGGRGVSNWSEGCQVICGKGYINHEDTAVDCTSFAALNYTELGRRAGGTYKTKGAYSVLVDLVTAFSGDVHAASYMLLYEQDLDLEPSIGRAAAGAVLGAIA